MKLLSSLMVARAPIYGFAAMGMVWGSYSGLIPDTMAMLGVKDATFGALLMATPVAAMLAMFMAPRYAPYLGPRLLPISIFLLAICYMLPGWIGWPFLFAVAMMTVGASNGLLDVAMNARVSALEQERDLHLMNMAHASYSFAYAATAVTTGFLREAGLAPGQIMTMAGLAILLGLPLAWEGDRSTNGFVRNAPRAGRISRLTIWGGLIVMISFIAENAAEAWSAVHIERTLGGSKQFGSMGPAILALTMGVGRCIGQAVVARVEQRRLLFWGTVVGAFGTALLGLAPNTMFAYLGLVIAGLGGSVLVPTALALIGRLSPPVRRAEIMARATTVGYFGFFVGPPTLGILSQFVGLSQAFVAIAALMLVILLLVPRLSAEEV